VLRWIAPGRARRPACPPVSANQRLNRSQQKEGAHGGNRVSPELGCGAFFKRQPMDSRHACAEAGLPGRERKLPPAPRSTQGGGSWGKPGFPHDLIADVDVVVVVGEREGRSAQAEQ